ncbi:MAG: TetR/AcrR family transcriptional regulator [Acidobacteria bacterium]|nr:TetR/AcrR family transcriptional regulator [Acidobacteriota bacterium]
MPGPLTKSATTKPGRPRDDEAEQRILDVTLDHLSRFGYSRMSIDGIAQAAQVSKPTIYRRWPGKEDLAVAAVARLQVSEPPVTGDDTVTALTAILTNFRRSLLRPRGMALLGTVLAEEEHAPRLITLFRERIVSPRRAMLRTVLERAAARGELQPEADLDAAVAMLVGSFYARYLAGQPIKPDWPARVVALVWPGLARTRTKAARARHSARMAGQDI